MPTTDLFLKMILDRWDASLKNFDSLLNTLDDATLQKEVAPGKNRGIYLLGHVVAVHDDMLVLLAMGERKYPALQEPFLKSPDKAVADIPAVADLKKCWADQCELIKQEFAKLQPEQWFEKHTAVSAEDFVKEPHRNKLNVVITRTTHLTYHTGQLALLK